MKQSSDMVVKTANLPTLILGISSVMMGWAAATAHGNGELFPGVLCLFFAVFMQLYHNWNHRYYDIKYKLGEYIDDGYDLSDTNVLTSHSIIREMSHGSLVLAAMAGFGLLMLSGWWTLIVGGVVFCCAWFNSHGNSPLLRTSANTLMTFFVFGPIGVIATELVQSTTGHTHYDFMTSHTEVLSWFDIGPAVILCVPAGLMAMAAHLSHGYRKYDLDIDNNKNTLTTLVGLRHTANLYLLCALLVPVFYVLYWLFATPAPPLWALMIAPVFVCAYMISRYTILKSNQNLDKKIIEEETAMAFLFLALCTYFLGLTTGSPNDSPIILYN